jgi:hypothetical protein
MLDRTKRAAKLAARRARDARYRQRVKASQRCAVVVYNGDVLNLLIRAGALKPEDCGDAIAIGKAITALLEASARH